MVHKIIWGIIPLFIAMWVIRGQMFRGVMILLATALLGVAIGLKLGVWASVATFLTSQVLRIGYGNWSPRDDNKPSWLGRLTRDTNGWYIRLLWGLIVSLAIGGPYAYFTHHYAFYFLYIIGNCATGYAVSRGRLNVFLTDTIVGLALSSIMAFPA